MQFAVLDDSVGDIADPDTGESLGTVRREKVKVEVVRVDARFCVARTYERVRSGGGSLGGVAAFLQATGSRPAFRTKTLRQSDAEWKHISEDESYVKVGDPVEEIVQSTTSAQATGSDESSVE